MVTKNDSNNIWRTVAAWLFGLLIAGGGTWLTWGQHSITRAQVTEMIKVESPYIEDRRALQELLHQNSGSLERLSRAVEELKIEQARLVEKLESYIARQTDREEKIK